MLRIEVKKGNINRALKELRYKFRNTKRLQRLKELKYCDGAARMENGRLGRWQSGHLLGEALRPLAGR